MSSLVVPEKEVQLKLMGKYVAHAVREYFQNPEHRKKFEDWYRAKYGREYIWKTIDGKECKRGTAN